MELNDDCWGVVASHAGFLGAWVMTQVSKQWAILATGTLRAKSLALLILSLIHI